MRKAKTPPKAMFPGKFGRYRKLASDKSHVCNVQREGSLRSVILP